MHENQMTAEQIVQEERRIHEEARRQRLCPLYEAALIRIAKGEDNPIEIATRVLNGATP